nr:hypothetical protein [Tanacetum cinerariifolium]
MMGNPPSKHLVFEEPEIDRQGPNKLVVGKPRVGKQEIDLFCPEVMLSPYLSTQQHQELQYKSVLVEITDMSMWVLFIVSEELLVLDKSKKTMLQLKIVSSNCWNNNCILVTLGGCLEQLGHSTLIGHRIYGFRKIVKIEVFNPLFQSLEEVKDDILCEKLLNINFLIAKIESLNKNPTPDCVLKSPSPFPILVEDSDSIFEKYDTSLFYSDNSLLEFETFSDHTKETSSGSTTAHADNSLPEYDSFLFEIEPDQGELNSVVMEDILGEPHVHVPNVLPTHPTLMLDSDFIPSDDSLGSNLEVSFPSRTRNKIFYSGIFFEVQSKIFLSRYTFSISIIRNLPCPVSETLLLFSSENEDKVFNPGILSSNLLSHRGKITFDFSESPVIISRGDIPFLDDLFLHFYPP